MKKVSIIIPVYNSEKFLAESIESALKQTWGNIEVIVINDGSTDKSLSVAKAYESEKVKVYSIRNSGQCAATNFGLRCAKGEFIQFLDADDLLDPKKIEIQIKILKEQEDNVAIGAWARFSENVSESVFIPEKIWNSMEPVKWLTCQWSGGGMMANSAYLIPKKIIEKAGPYLEELNYNNDFEYFTRVVLASEGVVFCAESKSFYRSNISCSLSQTRSYEASRSEFLAK